MPKNPKNAENPRFFKVFLCTIQAQKTPSGTCPDGLWLVDIQPAHQPVELLPGQVSDLRSLPGPAIASLYSGEPLVDQDISVRFFQERLDAVRPPAAKQEERVPGGVHLKLVLNDGDQTIYGFAHVGVATDDVDPVDTGDIS